MHLIYIHGSVHRNSKLIRSNKTQQYAGIYLLQNHSTCFGCPSHPSSWLHKTVIAASGTGHNIWATTFLHFWYHTFVLLWMLCAFFWVIPRRLNFICRHFGTLCLLHLHRQVGLKELSFIPNCLWRWNRQSVPKRRHIKFRRRVITKKKAYNLPPTWPNKDSLGHIGGRLIPRNCDLYQRLQLQFYVLLMIGAMDTRNM
jgi:hypothetical protein